MLLRTITQQENPSSHSREGGSPVIAIHGFPPSKIFGGQVRRAGIQSSNQLLAWSAK
jgi:hypothetical protein